MTAAILLVDDDRRLMRRYADALSEAGFNVKCCHGSDEAIAYLESGAKPDIIVWDMMMPPGDVFAREDTEGGLATGRFLYRKMRLLHPDGVYILLTNDINVLAEYHRPELHSLSYAKIDIGPHELAEHIKKYLKDMHVNDGGVPR